jgi:hypothetical protein
LWRYLKENVYTKTPHSLDELKQNTQKCTLYARTACAIKWMHALLSILEVFSTYCATVSVISIVERKFSI